MKCWVIVFVDVYDVLVKTIEASSIVEAIEVSAIDPMSIVSVHRVNVVGEV